MKTPYELCSHYIFIYFILVFLRSRGGGNISKTVKTDLASDLETGSTLPSLSGVDILHGHPHSVNNISLALVGFQHVARGDGDFPVAAGGVLDGVVLAGKLDELRCVGERDDPLPFLRTTHLDAGSVVCVTNKW